MQTHECNGTSGKFATDVKDASGNICAGVNDKLPDCLHLKFKLTLGMEIHVYVYCIVNFYTIVSQQIWENL